MPTTRPGPHLRRLARLLPPLLAVTALAACDAERRLPTEATVVAGSGATVQGVVTGGKAGLAADPAATTIVRVEGVDLFAVTDASGAFTLFDVPPGTRTLVFERDGAAGTLVLPDLEEEETVELVASLEAGGVAVTTLIRQKGGGGGPLDPASLRLQLSPDTWNLEYDHSSGTVEAALRGNGLKHIDQDTVRLVGDDESVEPLAPKSVSLKKKQLRARFLKRRVLDLLADPERGSTHTVALVFNDDAGARHRVEVEVEIVGPEDEGDDDGGGDDGGGDDGGGDDGALGDLSLQLSPGNWNVNFAHAGGKVQALVRGDGLSHVDLDSFEMEGDNGTVLAALRATREGNHVKAQWAQNRVLTLLMNPGNGSTHTVIVRFADDDGGSHELTTTVRVNGKP